MGEVDGVQFVVDEFPDVPRQIVVSEIEIDRLTVFSDTLSKEWVVEFGGGN